MNDQPKQPLTGLQKIESKIDVGRVAGTALSSASGGLAFQNLSEVLEVAKLMALADVAVPKHLRQNPGACLAVTIQAVEWEFSPFQVANKSYSVNDRLAYEAQLIHAVILKRAPIEGRPEHEYSGEGAKRKLRVWAKTTEGQLVDYTSPELGNINPKNSPLWKNDPDQQLHYFSMRSWCRRHFPDVILGVYSKDEMEDAPKDITPKGSGLADRLQGGQGGFDPAAVQVTLESATAATASGTTNTQPGDDSPVTDDLATTTIDWNDAIQVAAALKAGELPDGFSVMEDGTLVIPDELAGKKGGPRGHSMIAALYNEIVTASGVVVKTKTAGHVIGADAQHDPEYQRAGAQAFSDGEERRAPDDLSPADAVAWLDGYDTMAKGQK